MYKGDIPFNEKGSLIGHVDAWNRDKVRWQPNVPFRAVLTIDSFSRGRSAANYDLLDRHGNQYTMFMTDMLDLLLTTTITKGKTELLMWSFCKRGQNYGVKIHG